MSGSVRSLRSSKGKTRKRHSPRAKKFGAFSATSRGSIRSLYSPTLLDEGTRLIRSEAKNALKEILKKKEETITQQNKQITDLQKSLVEDHKTLQTLDSAITSENEVVEKMQQKSDELQNKFIDLGEKLKNLDQRHQEIKQEITHCNEEILAKLTEKQLLQSQLHNIYDNTQKAKANEITMEYTIKKLTCEIKQLEDEKSQLLETKTQTEQLHEQLMKENTVLMNIQKQIELKNRDLAIINNDLRKENNLGKDIKTNLYDAEFKHKDLSSKIKSKQSSLKYASQLDHEIKTTKRKIRKQTAEANKLKSKSKTQEHRLHRKHQEISKKNKKIRKLESEIKSKEASHTKVQALEENMIHPIFTHQKPMYEESRHLDHENKKHRKEIKSLRMISADLQDQLDSAQNLAEKLRRERNKMLNQPVQLQPIIVDHDFLTDSRRRSMAAVRSQQNDILANQDQFDDLRTRNRIVRNRMNTFDDDLYDCESARKSYFPTSGKRK